MNGTTGYQPNPNTFRPQPAPSRCDCLSGGDCKYSLYEIPYRNVELLQPGSKLNPKNHDSDLAEKWEGTTHRRRNTWLAKNSQVLPDPNSRVSSTSSAPQVIQFPIPFVFIRNLYRNSSLFRTVSVACTVAINKWREFESKSIIQQQEKQQGVKVVAEITNSSDSVGVHKALK